jgi:hypothetical protein
LILRHELPSKPLPVLAFERFFASSE